MRRASTPWRRSVSPTTGPTAATSVWRSASLDLRSIGRGEQPLHLRGAGEGNGIDLAGREAPEQPLHGGRIRAVGIHVGGDRAHPRAGAGQELHECGVGLGAVQLQGDVAAGELQGSRAPR